MKFLNNLTVSENIALLLTEVKNNSELHTIEQTIAYRANRGDITYNQADLFNAECKELRKTEIHYNRV